MAVLLHPANVNRHQNRGALRNSQLI